MTLFSKSDGPMKMTLVRPCPKCPFRTDIKPYLRKGAIDEFKHNMLRRDHTFTCHETQVGPNGEYCDNLPGKQHCAGALILLEKLQKPNQYMRIMERLGFYDRKKLDMKAPVFDSFEEMREAQEK